MGLAGTLVIAGVAAGDRIDEVGGDGGSKHRGSEDDEGEGFLEHVTNSPDWVSKL